MGTEDGYGWSSLLSVHGTRLSSQSKSSITDREETVSNYGWVFSYYNGVVNLRFLL